MSQDQLKSINKNTKTIALQTGALQTVAPHHKSIKSNQHIFKIITTESKSSKIYKES